MRARSFKLRLARTALISLPMHIQRETAFGGFHKRSAYCNYGPACGNRQMHKAEGVASALLSCFSSATPGATAADCACIASCAAFTNASCELAGKCKQCVNEWS